MKRLSTAFAAIVVLALLVVAAPASAKPKKTVYYDGKSVTGQEFSFALTGKRITDVNGYMTTTCVPTHGTPTTGSTEFDPPGSFVLGKAGKASETENMAYKGDVTKNYEITFKKGRGLLWTAHLHVDYSYEEVFFGYGSEIEQKFFICQGDDDFRFIA
jgi:hypothetical protein